MGIGQFIDRFVGIFDPVAEGRRMVARAAVAQMGGWEGARRNKRSMQDWKVSSGSANADLAWDLPTLRDRSRDLERNSPISGGALATRATNVVGTGLQLQSRIDAKALGLTPELAAEWQADCEREWAHFCRTCDLSRMQNFDGLTDLVYRSKDASGDVFAFRRYQERHGEIYGLKLQIVEADRVANPRGLRDGGKGANGNVVTNGVEIDGSGAPVAVHVLPVHPGDLDPSAAIQAPDRYEVFDAIGRRRVLQIFRRRRPGQDRGYPYLSPVIESLKQLARYSQAELDAAVLQSFFAIFLESPSGAALEQAPGTGESTAGPGSTSVRQVGPASIVGLPKDHKVHMADPTRPNGNFDAFTLAFCRQVGVALEMPYELLVKHFTASYSAARAALLEAWKTFRAERAWLVSAWCEPVYEWFMTEAVLRGRLAAPGFLDNPIAREAWLKAEWIGPAPGQIDEMKEVQAAAERVKNRFSNRARETAHLTGADWDDVNAQLLREEAQLGIKALPAPKDGDDEPEIIPDDEDQDRLEEPDQS